MCLGVPAEVKEVKGDILVVKFGDGVIREVYGATIDDVHPGDIVIVHAGIVIEKLKKDLAVEMMKAIQELIEDLEFKASKFFS